jgi:UDP-N-acetyl-D-galactosamine dehydrogenase
MGKRVIGIIGLGYVGLPLAVEFGKANKVIGFDINKKRIEELKNGFDKTLEVEKENLKSAEFLNFTTVIDDLRECNYFIITVPTPTDEYNRPDLTPLLKASETVGTILKSGDIVIYESTVYPGCTEGDCVPVLEKFSGLKYNEGFFCGYSPERINPGDKEHTVTKIKKITSGSNNEIAEKIDDLYKSIIIAGTHKASSIKIAEAAKVIENSQRDINIAFVNELSRIFHLLDIDTIEVLKAAGTKWNFLNFRPGLVGGHCIGVDPYYLTHKAESLGYHSEVILSGRRINDGMGIFCAQRTIKLMIKNGLKIDGQSVLIIGITFKENCPDIRNSRVIDIINEMAEFGCCVEVYDPHADFDEVEHEYNIKLVKSLEKKKYGAIILAVSHSEFMQIDVRNLLDVRGVIFDVKSFYSPELVDGRL